MGTVRELLIRRQVRGFRRALAALHGATRHSDDYPAVRITLTDPETGQALDSMALRLLAFTELVDAVHARSSEIARQPTAAQPTAPVLRMVPTDSLPTTTDETRTP